MLQQRLAILPKNITHTTYFDWNSLQYNLTFHTAHYTYRTATTKPEFNTNVTNLCSTCDTVIKPYHWIDENVNVCTNSCCQHADRQHWVHILQVQSHRLLSVNKYIYQRCTINTKKYDSSGTNRTTCKCRLGDLKYYWIQAYERYSHCSIVVNTLKSTCAPHTRV